MLTQHNNLYRIITILAVSVILLSSKPGSVAVQGQSNPTVLLAVESDLAQQIKTKLGDGYTYVTSDPSNLVDDVNRAKIVDQSPDVIIGWNDYIPSLAVKNLIAPVGVDRVTQVHPALERGVTFFEVSEVNTFSAAIADGTTAIYGYPIAGQTTLLLVNPDLVASSYDFSSYSNFKSAALASNDQTNPNAKVYGLGFNSTIDPSLALYYAESGRIFQDNIIDNEHLIVNKAASIDAIGGIDTLVNKRRLNPQDPMTSDFSYFTTSDLAILMSNFNTYDMIKDNTTLGPASMKVYNFPTGAPVHSYAVMTPVGGDVSVVNAVKDKLWESGFQKSVVDSGLIPVTSDDISATSLNSNTKDELIAAYDTGLKTPRDPKWDEITAAYGNEMAKMIAGGQNNTRTALAIDVALRIYIPNIAQWGAVPEFASDTTSKTPFSFELWMILIPAAFVGLIRKRREY